MAAPPFFLFLLIFTESSMPQFASAKIQPLRIETATLPRVFIS